MEPWHDFFVGELGAATALAGLLFVGLSVNQDRILKYAGLPERALQGLSSLFLVFAVSTLALTPDPSPRGFGGLALGLVICQTAALSWLQRRSWRAMPADLRAARKRTVGSLLAGQAASWVLLIGSALIVMRNDWTGLAWYPAGVILAFGFACAVSWVLLIEINR